VTATLDLRGRRQNSVPVLDKWGDPNAQGLGPYGYGTGVTYASGTDGAEYEMSGVSRCIIMICKVKLIYIQGFKQICSYHRLGE